MRKSALFLAAGLLAVVAALLYTTRVPAAQDAVSLDPRNSGYELRARKTPLTGSRLTLTLQRIDPSAVAPLDLVRGVMQAAGGAAEGGHAFDTVAFDRDGETMFWMDGEEFLEIGLQYKAGQNPIYLVRTLPEKLRLPDGRDAFGRWTGGLLGVTGEQMEDVSEFALAWITADHTQISPNE